MAPADTLDRLAPEADEIVCLETPEFFQAVGAFFRDFSQVSDEEAVAALAPGPRAPHSSGDRPLEPHEP